MDWTIFITTIPATSASFKEILAIYGLRWRIEINFQGMEKSYEVPALAPRVQATTGHPAQSQAAAHHRLHQSCLWPLGADLAAKLFPAA
jgi:hypothetical protein